MQSFRLTLSLAVASFGIGGMLLSCGPHNDSGHGGAGGTGGGGAGSSGGGSGGSDAGMNSGCVGLQCQQMDCPGGATTTLTGKVYAPNGTLPLFNAIVYVPNTTPAAFTDGVSCDRCNGEVSGDPVVQTLTDATGSFTLTNVPVGSNIPLVIQLGKWRRQTTIASVPACVSTALDASATSLPSKASLGDIPRIAIATGSADPMECLLLKVGIDPSEITPSSGSGRIHFYLGGTMPGTTMSGAVSESDATNGLFSSAQRLDTYDVVLLPCEGTADYSGTNNDTMRGELVDYLNAGGRVFSTHYSYQWLTYASSPFNKITKTPAASGQWNVGQPDYYSDTDPKYTLVAPLTTTFPKGLAFSQWLVAAGAMSPMGFLDIFQGRHDITDVDPTYAQDWITYDFATPPTGVPAVMSGPGVMHLTFNTPLDAPPDDMGQPQFCGRAVFSDFHVTNQAFIANPTGQFPSDCKMAPMTDQEKALAFMLFDLSSCVQADQTPPIP